MPLASPDSNLELAARIQKIERQLHAVMSQPNMIISNNTGQKVLSLGLQTVLPGGGTPTTSDPQTFGLQLLDSSGAPIASFGEQPSNGNTSLSFYSTSGDELLSLNQNGMNVYNSSGDDLVALTSSGVTVYNTSGTAEVVLGDVGDGIYGLAVLNPAGVLQMVSGRAYAQQWGVVATGLSGNGTFANFPSITVTAGPSGLIDLEVGAQIILSPTAAGNVDAQVVAQCTSDASVNDLAFVTYEITAPAASTNGWSASVFSASTTGGLTPGTPYTFNLTWGTSADVTLEVANLVLRAIPM